MSEEPTKPKSSPSIWNIIGIIALLALFGTVVAALFFDSFSDLRFGVTQ